MLAFLDVTVALYSLEMTWLKQTLASPFALDYTGANLTQSTYGSGYLEKTGSLSIVLEEGSSESMAT